MKRCLSSVLTVVVTGVVLLSVTACASSATRQTKQEVADTAAVEAELALLRQDLVIVHARRDPTAYAALHTQRAIFEWQGIAPVVGRTALEGFMENNWAARRDIRITFEVSDITVDGDRAYEFGSYTERWLDPNGSEVTEIGRYVIRYVLEPDIHWRIDRFLGFADSTFTKQVDN